MKRKIALVFSMAVLALNFSSCMVGAYGHHHHHRTHGAAVIVK
jgi:hypothetical protein